MNRKSNIWSTGLAMFAMFFGAGNIVFPLVLGQFAQGNNFFGIIGMILTAVFVPLLGLMAMLLYEGDYNSFFKRIGNAPGFFVILLILAVIGPFGGIPRCITISHSTLQTFVGQGLSLPLFSLVSCAVIFFFTYRPNKILSLMGYVLTPVLLVSLAVIAVKGAFFMPESDPSMYTRWQTFSRGFLDGYHTMDLLAAFFFSSVVLLCLKKEETSKEETRFLSIAIIGGLIAAFLLSSVYISFSYLAAGYSHELVDVPGHQLLGTLAYQLLGPYAGMIASVAVTFAVLTTEIALTAVFAEFLHKTLTKEKLSYPLSLLTTLFLSFLVSTLHFEGISSLLAPILKICYPALIVLSILNILYKRYNFQPVKSIFYGTVAVTVIAQLIS